MGAAQGIHPQLCRCAIRRSPVWPPISTATRSPCTDRCSTEGAWHWKSYTCVTGTAKRRRDKPGGGSGWSWRAAIRKEGADNAGSLGGGVGSGSAVNTMAHWVARCQKLSWKQVPTCRPAKAIDLSRVEGSRNYDYHQCKTKFTPISQVTCRCMKRVGLATLAEVLQKVPKPHKNGLHNKRTCHADYRPSCVVHYRL